jgi:4-hydroxy-3-methylbut-2-enyl diphosphate reductase
VDGPDGFDPSWLAGVRILGVTAGASAPDSTVRAVIEAAAPGASVELLSVSTEDEYFPPPPQLRSLLGVLQGAVEGGFSARRPGLAGPLDDDRSWGATEALEALA